MIETNPSSFLVSIIIATFNAARNIENCLNSIKSLANDNIEVLVIDGGSTDETIKLVSAMGIKNLTLTSEPDKGIYDAFNKGIDQAKGSWIHFLGADDFLLAGFNLMIKELKDDDTIYYGDSIGFYENEPDRPDNLFKGAFTNYRLAKHCMNHQSILYPISVFEKQRYALKYKVFADYHLNIKLWGNRKFIKKHLPISIAKYNMTGFSSVFVDQLFFSDKAKIIFESMSILIYLKYKFRMIKASLKGKR